VRRASASVFMRLGGKLGNQRKLSDLGIDNVR
jgi:hypothetical protein